MGAWQNAVANFNRTHSACVATINAWLTGQNLTANDFGFHFKQQSFNRYFVKFNAFCRQRCNDFSIGGAASLGTCLFVADLVSGNQFILCQSINFCNQWFVFSWCFPIPHRFAGITHQVVNGVDGDIALFVAEHHRAQHDFFAELLRF